MNIAELYKKTERDVFDINSKVDVFITKPLNHNDLQNYWQFIRNDIAEKQRLIDDEFERWNHYLFYLAEEDAVNDTTLKYKIEHDTISSRKIVISTKDFREQDFNVVINRYIKYSFEEINIEEMEDFNKSPEVVKLIK